MILFYVQWSLNNNDDNLVSSLESIWKKGAVPILSWEPMLISNGHEEIIPYQDILEGKFDSYIIQVADEIKNWRKPVFLRFAHEMNISRYHWGTSKEAYGPESPAIYKKIYLYVWNIFNKRGVQNALWVFCPNVDSIPNEAWNQAKDYYPGSQYVNYFGLDGYDWEENKSKSFEQIFNRLYKQLKEVNPEMPMIVFETATPLQDKESWIIETIKKARQWGIVGIIWFQVDKEKKWKMSPFKNRTDFKIREDSFQETLSIRSQ